MCFQISHFLVQLKCSIRVVYSIKVLVRMYCCIRNRCDWEFFWNKVGRGDFDALAGVRYMAVRLGVHSLFMTKKCHITHWLESLKDGVEVELRQSLRD